MTDTTIEIFVPVRNGGALLTECIESILIQDDRDFTVTVMDNASTDDTPDRVTLLAKDDKRLKLMRSEDGVDLAGNFNRCIKAATQPYFAIVHADDRLKPQFISGMKKAATRFPEAWLIFCQGALINDTGDDITSVKNTARRLIYKWRGPELRGETGLKKLASYNHLMAPCAIYRREALPDDLLFDGTYQYLVDQTFWLSVLLAGGTIGQSQDILYEHRIHGDQLSAFLRNAESTLAEIEQFAPSLAGHISALKAWKRYGRMLSIRKKLSTGSN
ncbi:MAG: glycosyltransferase family 2 protein [Paracoccaceae bacterium]